MSLTKKKGKASLSNFTFLYIHNLYLGLRVQHVGLLTANPSDYMRTMMMEECTTIRLESERDRSGLGQL